MGSTGGTSYWNGSKKLDRIYKQSLTVLQGKELRSKKGPVTCSDISKGLTQGWKQIRAGSSCKVKLGTTRSETKGGQETEELGNISE